MKYYIYRLKDTNLDESYIGHTWADGKREVFRHPTTLGLFDKLGSYKFYEASMASGWNKDSHMIARSKLNIRFDEKERTLNYTTDVEACDELVDVMTWYVNHIEFDADTLEEAVSKFVDYAYDIDKYEKEEFYNW